MKKIERMDPDGIEERHGHENTLLLRIWTAALWAAQTPQDRSARRGLQRVPERSGRPSVQRVTGGTQERSAQPAPGLVASSLSDLGGRIIFGKV